jgi:hypothetical protein
MLMGSSDRDRSDLFKILVGLGGLGFALGVGFTILMGLVF